MCQYYFRICFTNSFRFYLLITVSIARHCSRSRSSVLQCSRCASVISMSAAASRLPSAPASRVSSRPSSQMSLMLDKKLVRGGEREVQCKICLYDCAQSMMVKLEDCGCSFCKDVSLQQMIRS